MLMFNCIFGMMVRDDLYLSVGLKPSTRFLGCWMICGKLNKYKTISERFKIVLFAVEHEFVHPPFRRFSFPLFVSAGKNVFVLQLSLGSIAFLHDTLIQFLVICAYLCRTWSQGRKWMKMSLALVPSKSTRKRLVREMGKWGCTYGIDGNQL